MKKAIVCCALLTALAISRAIAYAYDLGYSRGSRDESLHWLVSYNYNDGILTARENPEHPLMPKAHLRFRNDGSVNFLTTDSVFGGQW